MKAMSIPDSRFNDKLTDIAEMTLRVLTKKQLTDYSVTVFLVGPDEGIETFILSENPQKDTDHITNSGMTMVDLLRGFGEKLSRERPMPAAAFVAAHAAVAVADKPGGAKGATARPDECIFIWGCCSDGRTNGADVPVTRGNEGQIVPRRPDYLYIPTSQGAVDLKNNLAARLLEGFGLSFL